MLFYDRRFATNHNFIFHEFDKHMRRQTNRAVSIRVDNRDARTESLMNMVNEPQFADQMKIAVDDPRSLEASNARKHILPLLKIVGSKVK